MGQQETVLPSLGQLKKKEREKERLKTGTHINSVNQTLLGFEADHWKQGQSFILSLSANYL